MKTLEKFITEAKNTSSEELAKQFVEMTLNANDSETIEDDIKIFLEIAGNMIYEKSHKDYPRFQEGILEFTKKF